MKPIVLRHWGSPLGRKLGPIIAVIRRASDKIEAEHFYIHASEQFTPRERAMIDHSCAPYLDLLVRLDESARALTRLIPLRAPKKRNRPKKGRRP